MDILGRSIQMHYNGSFRAKSLLGGIFTILISLFSTYVAFSFGIEIIQKKKPISLVSQVYSPNYTVSLSDFPFMVVIGGPGASEIPNFEKFATISARSYFMRTDPETKSLVLDSYPLQVLKCDADIHFGKYKDVFLNPINNVPIKQGLCINPNQINYENNTFRSSEDLQFMNLYATSPSKFITFFIEECKAPFSNRYGYFVPNTTCASQEEIDEILGTFYVWVYHLDNYVDISDFKEPNKKFVNTYTQMLTNKAYKKNWIRTKNTSIHTDSGFLMPEFSTTSFPQLDQYNNDMATGSLDLIFELNLETSLFNDYYERKYLKIQDLMAMIGGLFKFLSLMGYIANFFLSKQDLYLNIAESFVENKWNDINDNLFSLNNLNNNPVITIHSKFRLKESSPHSDFIKLASKIRGNIHSLSNIENSEYLDKFTPIKINKRNYLKSVIFCQKREYKFYEKIIETVYNNMSIEKYFKNSIRLSEMVKIIFLKSEYILDNKLEIENKINNTPKIEESVRCNLKEKYKRAFNNLLTNLN
jgi:hypothetical protein